MFFYNKKKSNIQNLTFFYNIYLIELLYILCGINYTIYQNNIIRKWASDALNVRNQVRRIF